MTTRTQIAAALMLALAGTAGADAPKPDKPAAAAPANPANPAKVQMPKPAPELAQAMKLLGGTRRCDGKTWMPDGTEHAMTATMVTKLDYDGFWLHQSWDGKMDEHAFRFDAYMTFDQKLGKWRFVELSSLGGQMVGMSDAGLKDGKLAYDLDVRGLLGQIQMKQLFDTSDPKAGLKVSAERSLDEGKTWQKDFAVICRSR